MITVSAFKWVPTFAQGFVRDLRVRWALEEAGIPYRQKLVGPEDLASLEYRACQPFGQVPYLEEDGRTLFESGAIVLHIAERSEVLLPTDEFARARAITWLFAALNTIEVVVQPLAELELFFPHERWAKERRPVVERDVRLRMAELSAALGEREYLEHRFSAGDLMMSTVLRNLPPPQFIEEHPNLIAYHARCEARPAFQRALRAQMEAFEKR
jgi:glutathione S-transferase